MYKFILKVAAARYVELFRLLNGYDQIFR